MFSSGSRTGGDDGQPAPREIEGQSPAPDANLLDEVLQQTKSLTLSDEALDPAELNSLLDIARRHLDKPLVLEIVIELVQALFSIRWPSLAKTPGSSQAASRQVAESLFDHPASQEQLRQFWTKLSEAAR